MVDDQIKLVISEIIQLREELKELKKDKRNMEKDIPEQLEDLKKSKKDIVAQMKELEEEFQANLNSDDTYNSFREKIVETEEQIDEKKEKLFHLIGQIPQDRAIALDVKVGEELIKLQTERQLHVYLNGKEEKMGKN